MSSAYGQHQTRRQTSRGERMPCCKQYRDAKGDRSRTIVKQTLRLDQQS